LSFTPTQRSVDCDDNVCNQGKDAVFEVNGFSIRGKIEAAEVSGCKRTPDRLMLNSIAVSLLSAG